MPDTQPSANALRKARDEIGVRISDPMWAEHTEVSKATLKRWHKAIDMALASLPAPVSEPIDDEENPMISVRLLHYQSLVRKAAAPPQAVFAQPVDEIKALIQRLRNTRNWLRESFGHWKDCTSHYDRAPFEAADMLELLVQQAVVAQPVALTDSQCDQIAHIVVMNRMGGESPRDWVILGIKAALENVAAQSPQAKSGDKHD